MYAYGRITYEDVFGCPHWTTFCWSLMPTTEWRAFKDHNDTDVGNRN